MKLINDLGNSKILIFNNQAGGGHKTAVEAMTQQIKARGGTAVTKDIFNDTLGKTIGGGLYSYWNGAMKSENLRKMNFALKIQPIGEFFMGIPAFFKITHMLLSGGIEAIINPQPAGLHAITKATHFANFINKYILRNKRQIMIYNVLTEMPTKDTHDFFYTYKRLSKCDHKICKLVTTMPLFEKKGQTEEEFWKKYTGFSIKNNEVRYDEFPLRQPFLEMAKTSRDDIKTVSIQVKTDLAKKSIENEGINFSSKGDKAILNIGENDSVHAIMLGSQAGVASTLHYVEDFIAVNKERKSTEKQFVFVFCGDHAKKDSLYAQVWNLIKKEKDKGNYPENVVIVPLEGQNAEQVAPIMRKCDSTITRSGGLTAMELYSVSDGQIFIHSREEDLLKGMPAWEAGNAHFLEDKKGAKVITPQNSQNQLQSVLSKKKSAQRDC